MKRPAGVIALALALAVAACDATHPEATGGGSGGAGGEPALVAEAGFATVPPRDVVVGGEAIHIAATARLFYNFFPADDAPEDKPIFVVFNGFSADVVRAFGTGPRTVADGGDVVDNPASLTKIGNLLYIEPRQSGFSYDLVDGSPDVLEVCGAGVFNEYVDASDVLYGVLEVLDAHPGLRGDVVWVGESYAGVRIQWIASYVRGAWSLSGYEDAALAERLAETHHAGSLVGGQVLLQPWLLGATHAAAIRGVCADPDMVSAVSAEVGEACPSADACQCAYAHSRSLYNYAYTDARQTERVYEGNRAQVTLDRARLLFGIDVTALPELSSKERGKGFKCSAPDASLPPEDELVAALGALPEGQAYFVPYNPLQPGKEVEPHSPDWREQDLIGAAFVDNLRDVPTFVTDGPFDLVVPTRALGPGLAALVGADRVDATDPSRIVVGVDDVPRTVEVHGYPSAGHMITMLEAPAWSADVAAFVAK
jgi:hypothetical protein